MAAGATGVYLDMAANTEVYLCHAANHGHVAGDPLVYQNEMKDLMDMIRDDGGIRPLVNFLTCAARPRSALEPLRLRTPLLLASLFFLLAHPLRSSRLRSSSYTLRASAASLSSR